MDTPQLEEQTRGPEHAREAPGFVQDLHCPKCAYCLFGVAGARCPECGYELEGLRRAESRIPWVHRRRIGSCRAYLQTVVWVIARPRQLFEELARDIDYAAARKFQVVTVALAAIVSLASNLILGLGFPSLFQAALAEYYESYSPVDGRAYYYLAVLDVWPLVFMAVCFALWVLVATGVPGYFFHPRSASIRYQNRTVALSYYATAPMCIFAICFPLVSWVGLGIEFVSQMELICGGLVVVASAFGLLASWTVLVRLSRKSFLQAMGRTICVAFGIPTLWFSLAFLLWVVVPFLALLVLAARTSLE